MNQIIYRRDWWCAADRFESLLAQRNVKRDYHIRGKSDSASLERAILPVFDVFAVSLLVWEFDAGEENPVTYQGDPNDAGHENENTNEDVCTKQCPIDREKSGNCTKPLHQTNLKPFSSGSCYHLLHNKDCNSPHLDFKQRC